jgi:hypothetical protein
MEDMVKRFFILSLWLVMCSSRAQAASQVNPLDLLQQACSLTRAKWICNAADSALLIKSMIDGGWTRVQNGAMAFATSWLQDAAQTAGQVICTENLTPNRCLSDMTYDAQRWLSTEPDKFYDNLFGEARKLYLSNLVDKMNGVSRAQVDSPTDLAVKAISTQINAKAKYYTAYAMDLQDLKAETEMGKLVDNSKQILLPPANNKPDPYLAHVLELSRPACSPSAPQSCLDPTSPEGGWVAQYKSKAATAVSTREELQTLVELQAEASGHDATNTLELSRRIQQVVQAQVFTNQQLQLLYTAITGEQKERQLEYQASLEREYSKALESGKTASSFYSSAGQMVLNNANAETVLNIIERY